MVFNLQDYKKQICEKQGIMRTLLKQIKWVMAMAVILVVTASCSDNSPIVATGNTQAYFKYSINGGADRVFDFTASGFHVDDTNSNGGFIDALDQTGNTTGSVSGSGRILRGANQ